MVLASIIKRAPTWLVYLAGFIPAIYYIWAGVTNQLGADPIATLENALGEWALIMLIAGLSVTPLLRIFGVSLVKFRRAIGLVAFAYVVLHFTTYLWLDRQWDWGAIWGDILKRPYITIGTLAFFLLLPLALTSNNRAISKLGAHSWRKLHRLVYPAALFGAVHYALLKKTWQLEPLLYVAAVVALLTWRWVAKSKKRRQAELAVSS